MLRARWTKLSLRNAPCARSSHKLSAIAGKAYLFGGEAIARNTIDSTLHVLVSDDGDSWKWQALLPESAPPARVGHAQAVLGSKLYVFGGRAGVEMGESELGDRLSIVINNAAGGSTATHGHLTGNVTARGVTIRYSLWPSCHAGMREPSL